MFRGASRVTLDDKGRMVLPTRQRQRALERSEGNLVVTVDRDPCLLIYPLPDWEQIERKLMSLPALHERSRRLQRLMVGHATEIDLDGQGRLLLPPELREYAGLTRHAMLIGQGNRLEPGMKRAGTSVAISGSRARKPPPICRRSSSLCRCERRATVVANKGDAVTPGAARRHRVQAIVAGGG